MKLKRIYIILIIGIILTISFKTSGVLADNNAYKSGKDSLQNNTKIASQMIKKCLTNETPLTKDDEDFISQYLNEYHNNFYSKESQEKYSYDERSTIDDIFLAHLQCEYYFDANKSDPKYRPVVKKTGLELIAKYLK